MGYKFTNSWFAFSELKNFAEKFIDSTKPNKILEIGSHEGASSCFLSDHFLSHPDSSLTCVDPFDTSDSTSPVTDGTMTMFLHNLRLSSGYSKTKHIRAYSSDFYTNNTQTFTFIYIDGSHKLEDITVDFNNCLRIIEDGGIIWMDDYLGGESHMIRDHINQLYQANANTLEIIHSGYQIAFRAHTEIRTRVQAL
jgi:predicted O-methyltransferase YrrM